MRGHRCILLGLAILGLTGCFGGGGSFTRDPAEVRRQVTENLNRIAIDISAEHVFEASKLVHADFVLQPEVAQKFDVGPFEGKGPEAFRSFFDAVVEKYRDLTLAFSIRRIDVDDKLATAYVQVTFTGSNAGAVPLAQLSFTENDILTFAWDGQKFALIDWAEDQHNQGGGGGF